MAHRRVDDIRTGNDVCRIYLEQRRAEHRQAMRDLVRGRSGHTPPSTKDIPPDAPTLNSQTETEETTALIRQLRDIARLAKGKTGTRERAREGAMVRRAERMHAQLVAEIERENRGPRSRPPGPCTLQISYVDADGVWTARKIAPYKSGNTNQKFDAWCNTRQARRTFYFERIQGAIDLTTGRDLSRAEVFRRIHPGRRVPADLR
jgi:hypothetical protein